MPRQPRRSDRAERDFAEIWHYIAVDSVRSADRFLAELVAACQRLAAMPTIGRVRPKFGTGIRGYSVKRYLIYYRETNDGIEVLRVVHGARHLQNLDEPRLCVGPLLQIVSSKFDLGFLMTGDEPAMPSPALYAAVHLLR